VREALLEELNRLGGSGDEVLAFEEHGDRRYLRAVRHAGRTEQRAQRAVVTEVQGILEPSATLVRDPDRAKDADQTTGLDPLLLV
jgi:hypothetical protein